jgi:hypothetical protein
MKEDKKAIGGRVPSRATECRSTNPLAATDKARNRATSSERVPCENVIAMLKRFKIIADR